MSIKFVYGQRERYDYAFNILIKNLQCLGHTLYCREKNRSVRFQSALLNPI